MARHLLRITLIYTGFEVFRYFDDKISPLLQGTWWFNEFANRNYTLLILSGYLIFLLYALLAFVVFEKAFYRNKRWVWCYLLVVALAVIALRYLVQEVVFPHLFNFRNYPQDVSLVFYFLDNTYYAFLYSAIGLIYFFLQSDRRRQLEKIQLLVAHKQSQLSFLRSQINPHFLFNSLNNIYSLVYRHSDKSLEAIAGLSELLRYMLYDNQERVPLQKELDYIDQYIRLQLLRYSKAVQPVITITGNVQAVTLAPLLLIPLVENAFKHGNPDSIQMRLEVLDDQLQVQITNRKVQQQKDAGGGIGLDNIRKRLALIYPGKHSLSISDEENIFDINLQLQYA